MNAAFQALCLSIFFIPHVTRLSHFCMNFTILSLPVSLLQHNDVRRGMDINVTGVWEHNITGEGVTVVVVDDGLQHTLEDIQPNYVSASAFPFSAPSCRGNRVLIHQTSPSVPVSRRQLRSELERSGSDAAPGLAQRQPPRHALRGRDRRRPQQQLLRRGSRVRQQSGRSVTQSRTTQTNKPRFTYRRRAASRNHCLSTKHVSAWSVRLSRAFKTPQTYHHKTNRRIISHSRSSCALTVTRHIRF